jgi:hypothetical protein
VLELRWFRYRVEKICSGGYSSVGRAYVKVFFLPYFFFKNNLLKKSGEQLDVLR